MKYGFPTSTIALLLFSDKAIWWKIKMTFTVLGTSLFTYLKDQLQYKNLSTNNNYKVEELLDLNKRINNCNNYDELIENKSIDELEYEDELINQSNYVHVFKKKR